VRIRIFFLQRGFETVQSVLRFILYQSQYISCESKNCRMRCTRAAQQKIIVRLVRDEIVSYGTN
jgi:hypothetical protein